MVDIGSYFFSQLCEGQSDTLACIAPMLLPQPSFSDLDQEVNYTVIMDNAMGPDIADSNLRLDLLPDPIFRDILESDTEILIGTNSTITITVCHSGKDL